MEKLQSLQEVLNDANCPVCNRPCSKLEIDNFNICMLCDQQREEKKRAKYLRMRRRRR